MRGSCGSRCGDARARMCVYVCERAPTRYRCAKSVLKEKQEEKEEGRRRLFFFNCERFSESDECFPEELVYFLHRSRSGLAYHAARTINFQAARFIAASFTNPSLYIFQSMIIY